MAGSGAAVQQIERDDVPPSFTADHIDLFAAIDPAEIAMMSELVGQPYTVRRRQIIRREGELVDGFFFLHRGWVASSSLLDDGGRQITKVHLAGEMMGTPSIAVVKAADTLIALTPAVVSRIPLSALGRLFRDMPRLAGVLFLHAQMERIALADRMASVGHSGAESRLAALFLHLRDRQRLTDPTVGNEYRLPLTQEDMADMLGLTAVHVNRTIRALEQRGVIARKNRWLQLIDIDALGNLARMPQREPVRTPDWLPPPATTRPMTPAAAA